MTVYAYKDGILAIDRQFSAGHGEIYGSAHKYFKRGKVVFVPTGDYAASQNLINQFLAWNGEGPPPCPDSEEFQLTIFCPGKFPVRFESKGWMKIHHGFVVGGSGYVPALAGLKMGLCAVEAAKLACEVDMWCGMPLDVFNIETGEHWIVEK